MVRVVIQVHPCSSKFILSHWRLIWIKKMEWLMDPPRNLFFAFLSSLFSPLRFLSFCLLSFFPSCSYLWSSLFILVQFHSTKFVCLFVFLSFCLSVFLFSTKSCFKAKNTHFGKFRTPRPPPTACLTGDKDPPGIFQGAWKYPGSWNFPGGLEISRTWKFPGPLENSRGC